MDIGQERLGPNRRHIGMPHGSYGVRRHTQSEQMHSGSVLVVAGTPLPLLRTDASHLNGEINFPFRFHSELGLA